MTQYHSLIVRDPKQRLGPGYWTLFFGASPVAVWPCITGGDVLDELAYGGLTPKLPSGMVMKYEIGSRDDLYNGQDHCAWLPAEEGEEKIYCPRRTWWRVGVDEFRTHQVGCNPAGVITGRSTGCPSIPDHEWERGKAWLNQAYQHSQDQGYRFITKVRDYSDLFVAR